MNVPVLSFEQCFILFCSFPLLFAFVVGGLGFESCVFVAGWRHALRSEWPAPAPGSNFKMLRCYYCTCIRQIFTKSQIYGS